MQSLHSSVSSSSSRSSLEPNPSPLPEPTRRVSADAPSASASTTGTAGTGFSGLGLIDELLRAVAAQGYEQPTPIQVEAIPHVLAGRDLLGCARTGTGKTAAFALPILQRLTADRRPRAGIRVLVLSPTRELANQIGDDFAAYGRNLPLRHTVVFGGVSQQAQERALARGVDVLVATPGRLLDLMQQGVISLRNVEVLVLDEADRMLDMGFIHDVRRVIAAVPKARQTLFFSATLPREIQSLASSILRDPVHVAVSPVANTAEGIDERVYFVDRLDKRALLVQLLADPAIDRALVFTRTKHGANKVAEHLSRSGLLAEAIHGNKSQSARERALSGFKSGRLRVLVATDIAARGIDVEGLSHVINFELPNIPETYIHRIGRTARAGASGTALSFCDGEEREFLADIERLTRQRIAVVADHPFARSGGRPAPNPATEDRAFAPRAQHDRGPNPTQHRPSFGGSSRGGSWRPRTKQRRPG